MGIKPTPEEKQILKLARDLKWENISVREDIALKIYCESLDLKDPKELSPTIAEGAFVAADFFLYELLRQRVKDDYKRNPGDVQ